MWGEASTTWRFDEWIVTVVYKRYLFSKKAILDVYIRIQEGKHQAFFGSTWFESGIWPFKGDFLHHMIQWWSPLRWFTAYDSYVTTGSKIAYTKQPSRRQLSLFTCEICRFLQGLDLHSPARLTHPKKKGKLFPGVKGIYKIRRKIMIMNWCDQSWCFVISTSENNPVALSYPFCDFMISTTLSTDKWTINPK